MPRALVDIQVDFYNRLISDKILPSFISRKEDDGSDNIDFLNFCNVIAEAFAPIDYPLEQLLNIYNDINLLTDFLIKRDMFLRGNEILNALEIIANNRLTILKNRGTKKQGLELDRLFVNLNDGDTEQDVYNLFHLGWLNRRTSPMYRPSSSAVNMSYLRLNELYAIYSFNNSTLADEEVQKILDKKFMPQHMDSKWFQRLNTIQFQYSKDYLYNSNSNLVSNNFVYFRIILKNLSLVATATEGYIISQWDSGTNKGYYLKIDNNNLILHVNNLVDFTISRNEVLGYGKWNIIDVYLDKAGMKQDNTNISFISAFLNGKSFALDTVHNLFDLTANGKDFRVGAAFDNSFSALFEMKYLYFLNDTIGNKIVYDFNKIDLTQFLYTKNRNIKNENLKLIVSAGIPDVLLGVGGYGTPITGG